MLSQVLGRPTIGRRQLGHRSKETLSTKEACDAPIRKRRIEMAQTRVVLLAWPVEAHGTVTFVRRSATRRAGEVLMEAVAVA